MLEGLPPNGATHVMRLHCDQATARRVADIVVETFDPAETAAAAFEETATERAPDGWLVEVYFGTPPDTQAVRALLAAAAPPEVAAAATFETVARRDWVTASLEGLEAVREGRFLIHGAHARAWVKPGDIAIEIEAALAFGTGHHGSTRGCLAMLNAVARQRRHRRILDVGTGTGVLAIAAARRLHRTVKAGDIDTDSVAAAQDNARRNRAGRYVRPVRAIGTKHPDLQAGAPYDLVFANILARPLRALARPIRRIVAPGGDLILSGLLAGDVPSVLSAYRAQGLFLVARREIDGWVTLRLRRPFSSA